MKEFPTGEVKVCSVAVIFKKFLEQYTLFRIINIS
jgi:hypothetical protein